MRYPARRLAAMALCAALALSGCGRQQSPPDGQPAPSPSPTASPAPVPAAQALTIGYTPSDGYNPYTANSSLVEQNAGLLFESLVRIGPDMALEYRLAESITVAGTQAVIRVRAGCRFADGQEVTAQDVLASLQAAQASGMYAGRFANVAGLRVQAGEVVVSLYQPDSLFAYLCDVPVLKSSEVGAAAPTASGRYTYGAEGCLVKNPLAPFAEEGSPDTIYLYPVAGYDEMVSSFALGGLNLYAALQEADASASISSLQSFYKTNNLVYLGVNAQSGIPLLDTAEGRALLSRLIDRRLIAEKSFYSRAYPAAGAINSFYPCVQDAQLIQAGQDTEGAAETLAALGYQPDPISGYYTGADGARLQVRLLVYSGNTYKRYAANLLKELLAQQGVYVAVEEQDDFDIYTELVRSGQFELYIGEVKLYNNMDISPFLAGGALSAGLAQSEAVDAAYLAFKQDAGAAGAFERAFAAQMPFVPLVWRAGTVVTSRAVSGVSASLSDVFYSLGGLQTG